MKKKIESFIKSDIMKDKLNKKMYKEYEFVTLKDNEIQHGIIDLLIDCNDYLVIIDYKLKNIDDSAYETQLKGYRDYIERLTNKKVECYLYSILDEKYKQIK